jgi:hypothetical protein
MCKFLQRSCVIDCCFGRVVIVSLLAAQSTKKLACGCDGTKKIESLQCKVSVVPVNSACLCSDCVSYYENLSHLYYYLSQT